MREKEKGFSLIETLVSLGILAVLSAVIASIIFLVLRSSSKTDILKEVKQNGEGASRVIQELIRQAATIDDKDNFCDGSNHSFLILVDPEGEKTKLDCDLGTARVASRSGSGFSRVVWLTNQEVACSDFQAQCQLSQGGSPLTTVSFSLQSVKEYPRGSESVFSLKVFSLED